MRLKREFFIIVTYKIFFGNCEAAVTAFAKARADEVSRMHRNIKQCTSKYSLKMKTESSDAV